MFYTNTVVQWLGRDICKWAIFQLFSEPEPIVIMRCLSSLTFHILTSPVTTEWNSTKLDRKQDLNILYQVRVFQADWNDGCPGFLMSETCSISPLKPLTVYANYFYDPSVIFSNSIITYRELHDLHRSWPTEWCNWHRLRWIVFNETCQEARSNVLYQLRVLGPIGKL